MSTSGGAGIVLTPSGIAAGWLSSRSSSSGSSVWTSTGISASSTSATPSVSASGSPSPSPAASASGSSSSSPEFIARDVTATTASLALGSIVMPMITAAPMTTSPSHIIT